MQREVKVNSLLYEITQTEAVLDAIESMLGPNSLARYCELFIKDAGSEKIVSWHQDMTYWGMGGSDKQATAWTAITNVSEEASCMRFVPGSHKQQLIPHIDRFAEDNLLSRVQEVAVDVNEDDAVLDELAPGEMSIHRGRIFHASGPNRSSDRRIGIAIRYVAPDMERSTSVRDYAILVRGVDECGNWINAPPPQELFGKSELATYKLSLRRRLRLWAQVPNKQFPCTMLRENALHNFRRSAQRSIGATAPNRLPATLSAARSSTRKRRRS